MRVATLGLLMPALWCTPALADNQLATPVGAATSAAGSTAQPVEQAAHVAAAPSSSPAPSGPARAAAVAAPTVVGPAPASSPPVATPTSHVPVPVAGAVGHASKGPTRTVGAVTHVVAHAVEGVTKPLGRVSARAIAPITHGVEGVTAAAGRRASQAGGQASRLLAGAGPGQNSLGGRTSRSAQAPSATPTASSAGPGADRGSGTLAVPASIRVASAGILPVMPAASETRWAASSGSPLLALLTDGALISSPGRPAGAGDSTLPSNPQPAPGPLPGGSSPLSAAGPGGGSLIFLGLVGLLVLGVPLAARKLRLAEESWPVSAFVLMPERPG